MALEGLRLSEVAERLRREALEPEAEVEFPRRVFGGVRRTARPRLRLPEAFDLTAAGLIRHLDPLRPIDYPKVADGHCGRDDLGLPWEHTAKGGTRT